MALQRRKLPQKIKPLMEQVEMTRQQEILQLSEKIEKARTTVTPIFPITLISSF